MEFSEKLKIMRGERRGVAALAARGTAQTTANGKIRLIF